MELVQLYLLASILRKQGLITLKGQGLLKELILSRDPRLSTLPTDSRLVDAVQTLIESKAKEVYESTFDPYPLEVAKAISKKERTDSNQIYGEVDFDSFARILRKVPRKGKFYDLGSGSGRAVVIARLLGDFDCCGIEIVKGLYELSLHVGRDFVHDSFTKYDWSDGTVVFANSTCFDDSLVDSIARLGERLAPGSIIITFTKGLNSNAFTLLQRKRYKMSWGPATVFIHARKNLDGSDSDIALVDIPDDDSYTDDFSPKDLD